MRRKIRPLEALRALQTLLDDPDDTTQAFRVIDALSAGTDVRLTRRLRATDAGRALLDERPDLLAVLTDKAALRALPEGSLGRAYLAFLEREKISAEGLVAASEDRLEPLGDVQDDDVEFLRMRLRDTHDLWHTVTGYHGDVIGEASILAFTTAQTRSLGTALLVVGALLRLGVVEGARSMVVEAMRRGLRARWLLPVRWEALLARPLDEVRLELGVGAPPSYEPLRTSDARFAELRAAA